MYWWILGAPVESTCGILTITYRYLSFQPAGKYFYDDYSTYMPSLIQFLPAVSPVGVTDLWPFMRKIDHNSINLKLIPTEIGMKMHFNYCFMCTKFWLDRGMGLQVMAENAKCAKWEKNKKKTKKLVWNFARSYLGIGWRDLLQIWYVDPPSSGASLRSIWLNFGKKTQSYIGVKITFFCLPINILTVWCDGFFGHTTATMCLDIA